MTYVVGSGDDNVAMIDGNTNNVTYIHTGKSHWSLAVNSETQKAYLTYAESPIISVIQGKRIIGSVSVTESSSNIAVNNRTNTLYVVNSRYNTISVMDPYISAKGEDQMVMRVNISVGQRPTAIAVNPYTNRIYVTNLNSDSVSIIDGSDDNVAYWKVLVDAAEQFFNRMIKELEQVKVSADNVLSCSGFSATKIVGINELINERFQSLALLIS
jgi:DNA-binding beta-propeller fold protein YncE